MMPIASQIGIINDVDTRFEDGDAANRDFGLGLPNQNMASKITSAGWPT